MGTSGTQEMISATTSWRRGVVRWWRAVRSVSGVCVDDEFLEQARVAQKRFTLLPSPGESPEYQCNHCGQQARAIRHERIVTVYTTSGRDAGVATWFTPLCVVCDSEYARSRLRNPHMVVSGWKRDGWHRLGPKNHEFLHFKMEFTNS